MNQATDRTAENGHAANVIVMNGLLALHADDNKTLLDDKSDQILRTAYNEVTTGDERDAFELVCSDLASVPEGEPVEPDGIFEDVTERVVTELDEMNIKAIVDHRSHIELPERSVRLYNVVNSRGRADVDLTNFSKAIRDALQQGIVAISNEEYRAARDAFESVYDSATLSDSDAITTIQVLLGWTHLWLGDKETAAQLAGESLTRCSGCWDAKLLWIAATHQRTIQEGVFDVGVFLEWMVDVPQDAAIRVQVRTSDDSNDWQEVSSYSDYSDFIVFDRLEPTQGIRFQLEGRLPNVPKMSAYYLGVGTVDYRRQAIEETERMIETGPITENVVEQLSFRFV